MGLRDSPLHMRKLIDKLDWSDVLVNVAHFLELISEDCSAQFATELRQCSTDQALDLVLSQAPQQRLEALSIDKMRLHKLTDVTNAFGLAGKKYDPTGSVRKADVFWVTPLMSVAQDRRQWMDEHLLDWNDFVKEPPRFHECEGTHSKMLNLEFVDSFREMLKRAMSARDL